MLAIYCRHHAMRANLQTSIMRSCNALMLYSLLLTIGLPSA